MLAEHDRCGPALAATPDTFPLNDVDFASSATWPPLAANLVFPDSDLGPFATVAPEGLRLVQTGGASRDRTDDLMLAKQPLSQLSYGPNRECGQIVGAYGGPGTTRTSDLTLIRGAL